MFHKKLFKSVRAGDAAVFTLSFLWICVIIQTVILSPRGRETAVLAPAAAEPTLILDAGHGGADGGAVAPDGTAESGLNLSVTRRVQDLCVFFGVDTLMTRESEELSYPPETQTIAAMKRWDTKRRVALADGVENAVFLSIHQNIYPSASPRGAQVLYAQNEPSRALAEQMQAQLTAALLPENRRVPVPAGKDIYILSHLRCPAVLVECGFLSHPQELALLKTEAYQKKIASVLTACYLQFTEEPVL